MVNCETNNKHGKNDNIVELTPTIAAAQTIAARMRWSSKPSSELSSASWATIAETAEKKSCNPTPSNSPAHGAAVPAAMHMESADPALIRLWLAMA